MKFLRAINNALGVRRYVIGGAITLGTLAYGWLTPYTHLPALPGWVLPVVIALLFVLVSVARHAAELEDKLKPRITVQRVELDHADTAGSWKIMYVHLLVVNDSETHIHACSANLVAMTRDGEAAPFNVPIQLVTSNNHEKQATLYPGLPQYFDVLMAFKNTFGLSEGILEPYKLRGFFDVPATYLLTVKVSGNDTATATARIKATWTGDSNTLQVELV